MGPSHTRPLRLLAGAMALTIGSAVALQAALTRPAPPGSAPPATSSRAAEVSSRYRQFCASCHGLDGSGRGPSAWDDRNGEFVGEAVHHRPADLTCPGIGLDSVQAIEQVVRGGISCKTHGQVMPAFPNLSPEQFLEIAEQVRAFSRGHGAEGHQHP